MTCSEITHSHLQETSGGHVDSMNDFLGALGEGLGHRERATAGTLLSALCAKKDWWKWANA